MRLLACTETVTLVRHEQTASNDVYTCEVIVGVSWSSKRGGVASVSGETPAVETIVRIPADVCPEQLPAKGDMMVRGVLASYEDRKSLKDLETFRVAYVGDNRRTRLLPHVVVKSQ